MRLTSPAFEPNGPIPVRHTADGADVAPPLVFHDVPPGAQSLALIVEDPDAPDPAAPVKPWVHWVLYDLPPDATGLPEGGTPLPAGTREGLNDWHRRGWDGPSPPVGRHRYVFRLHALDVRLPALAAPTAAALRHAMHGHVLATAELVGTYARRAR